jgi:hypothetical protein
MRTVTSPSSDTTDRTRSARSRPQQLIVAGLIAAAALASPITGALGTRSAEASDAIYTYAASGDWQAAVHTVSVTTPSGATVNLPLHVYVRGQENLPAARIAAVNVASRRGAKGGTDVEVIVNVTPAGDRKIGVNGAVRGLDVADGEGLFVQRGGTSDRPLIFSFHLDRA